MKRGTPDATYRPQWLSGRVRLASPPRLGGPLRLSRAPRLPLFARLLLLLLSITPHANATIRAVLDSPQVAPGETVVLSLTHDGQTSTQPDLTPLKQDFDVVDRRSSTSLQFINGRGSASTQIELTLAPKHAGQLTVPSLSWDADRTQPLTLVVAAGSGGAGGAQGAAGSPVFLETDADPKSPYVQGAVHVTVRVFAALPLSHASLEFPTTDAVVVRQGGSDETGAVERNGQSYQVVTRHYLVLPQRSGHLTIPGVVLNGTIPDRVRRGNPNDPFSGFFAGSPFGGMLGGANKPLRLNGTQIELDVLPRPSGAGASYWLPARNVTLTAQWRPTDLQAHVGDPVTVNLQLRAEDLTSAQLPDLSTLLTLPAGLKAYPDEPKLKDTGQNDTVVAEREQNIALIAEQPGQFTIPELRVNWWDTRTNQTREVSIPARTIVVRPADGSTAPTPTPDPQSLTAGQSSQSGQSGGPTGTAGNTRNTASSGNTGSSGTAGTPAQSSSGSGYGPRGYGPWPWISLGLGALWIATLIGWVRSHRRANAPGNPTPSGGSAPSPSASTAKAEFLKACRANDATAARRNLLIWANAALPGPRIIGLNALGTRLDDTRITAPLRDLDRACYVGDAWNGAVLADTLSDLKPGQPTTTRNTRELAPLYR